MDKVMSGIERVFSLDGSETDYRWHLRFAALTLSGLQFMHIRRRVSTIYTKRSFGRTFTHVVGML